MRFLASKLPRRILLASFLFALSFVYLVERHRDIDAENAQQDTLLDHPNWLAPYVPTPLEVIDAMLKLATVREADILYDLGSGDGLEQDLSEASVVTAYLLPKSLGKIAVLLQTQLKKGARVLSLNDEIPGWKFTKRLNVRENSNGRNWRVFLYVIR